MNQVHFLLQKRAIDHAKKGEWQQAVEKNQEIITKNPQDIAALNRLGFCFIQLKKNQDAKKIYEKVLEYDRLNSVAKKYLELLKKKKKILMKQVSLSQDFVEEPGKSRVIVLDRLSGSDTLNQLPVASSLILKIKGRYITVNTEEGEYIGSLPEDISFHLSSLIKTGNEYACVLRSASKLGCSVFIKEISRSEQNQNTPSFFSYTKNQGGEIDEDLLIGDMLDSSLEDSSTEDETEKMNEDEMTPEVKEPIPSDILGEVSED